MNNIILLLIGLLLLLIINKDIVEQFTDENVILQIEKYNF